MPARPASAVPQSNQAHSYAARPASAGDATGAEAIPPAATEPPTGADTTDAADADDGEEVEVPTEAVATGVMASVGASSSRRSDGGAYAACAAACVDAVTVAAAAASRPLSARRAVAGARRGRVIGRGKEPTACMHLHALTAAAAQHRGNSSARRPRSAPAAKATAAPKAAAAPKIGGAADSGGGFDTTRLASEIAALQARIRAREPEGAAAARLGRALSADEFGARAASTYTALVKQSIAGVRRAEALEVQRGVAAERNARRDARIEALRAQRLGGETARAEAARVARVASKEELGYRSLYAHALRLERERWLLAAATSEEARRKVLHGRRTRQAALEHFHSEQRALLVEQMQTEATERAFRGQVQRAMGARLEAEARHEQQATLKALQDRLDLHERLDYGVPAL